MPNNNHLTLAVAGSGKTQSIVDACVAADPSERILVLTYTAANQQELRDRLAPSTGDRHNIDVRGWFSFLINDFARPYLPYAYAGERVCGFDFKSEPQQGTYIHQWRRYFNKHGEARRVHLSQLAHRVNDAASGKPVARLGRVYDRIFIDEVQDLCGWDLEVLRLLMRSSVSLEMVGDVRQAILLTNRRETKNKKYQYIKIWDWFRAESEARRLEITQLNVSQRCRPEITELADSIFPDEMGFAATVSNNLQNSPHDGVYSVATQDVAAYLDRYDPLLLRYSASSGKHLARYDPMNIGVAKGLGRDHVLIHPTDAMKKFLRVGTPPGDTTAAYLYVAVTRAKQSVAFVIDHPGLSQYTMWSPSD